jgi:hypothetical protein
VYELFKEIIYIISYNDRLTWQSFDLEIGTEGIKVVTKDRRTLSLTFQEKEVEDLIRWQVS